MNDMLNRFSMYHGLLYGLVGIWGAAFVFSITGVLSYNALAMVASVAALAVSTGLASWLFGILFGVRSQGVSSLITAFIR